ncbi:MAG: gluconate 2-dehydrogenase subunit 3 family protein, partial [Tannerella sp.]|nr:gluconate 2-dehydrogenase subunit 3 family protein [Tannerella sp.]
MRKKRKVPGVNATSSADIAFMLLLFFLLTTSMNTDQGLPRRLPPPPDKETLDKPIDIKKRNMLRLLVDLNGSILCGEEFIDISQLKDKAKEFIANPQDDEHLPEKIEEDVPFFGRTMIHKPHVISLLNDRGTSYQKYIEVQNELAAAYRELRDDLSKKKWGKSFSELDEEQQKAVQTIYPQKISEA